MTNKRTRANGEGSILPYKNGFAAYAWVTKPDGIRIRKYAYGKTRGEVHEKWIDLLKQARSGPIATKVATIAEFLAYWLREIVEPSPGVLLPGPQLRGRGGSSRLCLLLYFVAVRAAMRPSPLSGDGL
jgi:hypothetical protein